MHVYISYVAWGRMQCFHLLVEIGSHFGLLFCLIPSVSPGAH